MMNIGIVGGGVAGLTAAYELAKRGIPCTIYERAREVGGLAGSSRSTACCWRNSITIFSPPTLPCRHDRRIGTGAPIWNGSLP